MAPRKKNVFTIAAVNDWNSLPEDAVTRNSIDVFKSKQDKHWEDFENNVGFWMGMETTEELIDRGRHGLLIRINLWTCELLFETILRCCIKPTTSALSQKSKLKIDCIFPLIRAFQCWLSK